MSKSYMQLRVDRESNTFCAFCKTPRKIPENRHVTFKTMLLSGGFIFFVMLATWGQADARALLLWVCIIGIAEVIAQTRWRLSINCRYCGFDPILYLKNPKEASARVQAVMDEKKKTLLGRLSLPDLPHRVVKRGELDRIARERGSSKAADEAIQTLSEEVGIAKEKPYDALNEETGHNPDV